jgi:hypothetical protein
VASSPYARPHALATLEALTGQILLAAPMAFLAPWREAESQADTTVMTVRPILILSPFFSRWEA